MKVISEYKLDKETIKQYRDKGYEVYYGYEKPHINKGESVGFLLDTMYPSTIDMIIGLLYRKIKSKITVKYKDQTYTLQVPDDWEYKYKDSKTEKYIKVQHPLLIEYLDKRREYFEKENKKTALAHTNYVLEYFNQEIPEDLDSILETFARLYEVDVDYNSLESKLLAYASIKYYLDNDIEYSREIIGTDPDDEAQFNCIAFGDETYLEDMIYQNSLC